MRSKTPKTDSKDLLSLLASVPCLRVGVPLGHFGPALGAILARHRYSGSTVALS